MQSAAPAEVDKQGDSSSVIGSPASAPDDKDDGDSNSANDGNNGEPDSEPSREVAEQQQEEEAEQEEELQGTTNADVMEEAVDPSVEAHKTMSVASDDDDAQIDCNEEESSGSSHNNGEPLSESPTGRFNFTSLSHALIRLPLKHPTFSFWPPRIGCHGEPRCITSGPSRSDGRGGHSF